MPLSQAALQGVLASATSEVYLECLVLEHSQLQSTVRLVNDWKDLPRNEGTFVKFPFEVTAPSQSQERPPILEFRATNVDQRIINALRPLAGLRERAKITYDVVLASSPNSVEFGPVVFEYENLSTDGLISLTLRASYLMGALNDAFPHLQFSPSNASPQ